MSAPPETGCAATRLEFHKLVDSVKDYAIIMLDPSGRIMTWNEGARRIKRYSEDEIIGHSFEQFYTPEDVARGRPGQLLGLARQHGHIEEENWRVRGDGTRFWADVVITSVRDDDGELVGFLKVTRDLTERMMANEALRQSEERLRLLVESAKDYAIFMLDPKGHVMSWNSGAQLLKGYTKDEVLGRHFSMFYPPENVDRAMVLLRRAEQDGRVEDLGWRRRKDGSLFWSDVVISSVRDTDGTLIGFAKVTRDMTDRRRAEAELAQRAEENAALAQISTDALRTPDIQRTLEQATANVMQTLELTEACVLELRPDGELLPRAGSCRAPLPRREALLQQALAVGTVIEEDEAAPPGQPRTLLALRIAGAGDTTAFGAMWIVREGREVFSRQDVLFLEAVANVIATAIARRRAEQAAELERVRTVRAEAAVRERDAFISTASHELRTPLAALQLKLQGLERLLRDSNAPLSRVQDRVLGAIRQGSRLANLIERLLDVSRISGGGLELSRQHADLAHLVRHVLDDLNEHATRSGCNLRLSVLGDTTGYWDGARVEQILVNLLENALKYGARQPVEISIEGREDSVLIRIEDRGIGIEPADVERIFERFERTAPLRHYPGLGLGLYITRHIVEAHGGTICVTSTPGEGSVFSVELPKSVSACRPQTAATGEPA